MPLTKLDLINRARVRLGAAPVAAAADDPAADTLYESLLTEMLRSHPWNFATARAALDTPLVTAPAFGYTAAYALPDDCLRVLETDVDDYRINSQGILASVARVELVYIARVDEALLDAAFAAAFACRLAATLAYAVTGSASLAQVLMQEYAQLLQQARSIDSQEQPTEEFPESSLITARG